MHERLLAEETEEYHAQLLYFIENINNERIGTEIELTLTNGGITNASTIN